MRARRARSEAKVPGLFIIFSVPVSMEIDLKIIAASNYIVGTPKKINSRVQKVLSRPPKKT
jgi:hypothetical protein